MYLRARVGEGTLKMHPSYNNTNPKFLQLFFISYFLSAIIKSDLDLDIDLKDQDHLI